MPTRTTLSLVDILVHEAGAASPVSGRALHEQAAVVRTLVDELEHRHPSEERTAALHAQLAEEVSRLAALVPGGPSPFSSQAPIDVLVVDDDDASLRGIARAARALGYPCRVAHDAKTALQLYGDRAASIVISDWNMPGMNGLALCQALKTRDPQAFVILVTAFHDDAQLRAAAKAGVDGLLPKPLEMDILEGRLGAAADLLRARCLLDDARAGAESAARAPLD